jgi:hypothetical protein
MPLITSPYKDSGKRPTPDRCGKVYRTIGKLGGRSDPPPSRGNHALLRTKSLADGTLALIAWLIAWIVLHARWKERTVEAGRVAAVSLVLVALGILGTFPLLWALVS